MMKIRTLFLALLSFSACSSSAEPSAAPPTGATLRGDYKATTPGPIVEMMFAEDQYGLVTNDCGGAAAPCFVGGTFRLDATAESLELREAKTGKVTVIAFHVIPGDATSADLHPEEVCVGKCCSNDTSSCTPEQLVSPQPTPMQTPAVPLAISCPEECIFKFGANGQLLEMTGRGVTVVPAH